MTGSSLLSEFDTLDKNNAMRTIDSLVSLMEKWATQYPFIRPVRIPSLALHNATVMPELDLADSALIVKLALWVFGIDDVLDEQTIPIAELEHEIAEQWYLIASGDRLTGIGDNGGLAAMLMEIRQELIERGSTKFGRTSWPDHVRMMIKAMVQEYQYKLNYDTYGAKALPSWDEYLQNGIYSSSIPLVFLTICILLDDPIIEVDRLACEAVNCTGAALRLYNDVRSYEKEKQQNTINAVVIAYHGMLDGDSNLTQEILSKAKQYVWQRADSYTQKCHDLSKQIHSEKGVFEKIAYRLAAFHASFYREHDYHHEVSTAKVNELLNVPHAQAPDTPHPSSLDGAAMNK